MQIIRIHVEEGYGCVVIPDIAARVMLLQIGMNTQTLGIPSTALSSDDHLIPAPMTALPTLIERLAASHAAVLEGWSRNFHLDLRRPKTIPA